MLWLRKTIEMLRDRAAAAACGETPAGSETIAESAIREQLSELKVVSLQRRLCLLMNISQVYRMKSSMHFGQKPSKRWFRKTKLLSQSTFASHMTKSRQLFN